MSNSAFLPENQLDLNRVPWTASGALQPESRGSGNDRALWETGSRLTLSLAPDGTKISRYESSLYASFGHMLNAQQLQETILNAFQTWARQSSVNVGVVPDSGDNFGIGGATQNDLRFGDIRVGAVPMAGDVFAVAVPHNELMSGTWAGDILFNSNANFADADQFFAVALHEAGHVLGLAHSTDPTSAMHPTALNQSLNSKDVLDVQSLYGNRVLDQYDLNGENNDTMETAVKIRNNGSINGIIPLVVFGDISGSQDVDFFYVRPNSDYQGSITFRLISKTVSVLRAQLTLVDETGAVIGSVSETSNEGTDISFQINDVDDGQEYFAKVESIGDTEHSFGSFALVTTIDGQLSEGYELIETAIRQNYGFLSQGDVQELFLSNLEAPILNDLHTNDTAATATVLEQSPNAAAQNDYRVQASLSDNVDVDFYRFEALDSSLTIRVNALESQLISKIRLFDTALQPISGEIKVNGNGELLVDFQGIVAGDDYLVFVAADLPGQGFDVGNYDMNLAFGGSIGSLETLGTGSLSRRKRIETHTLYIARTQLLHFALTGLNQSTVPNATIWMSVYDEDGNVMYRVATRPGETRTSQSVILRPGSYSMRVSITIPRTVTNRQASIFAIPDIDYRVDGIGVSDPTGPELIDPSEDPFSPCDKSNGQFCYPNDHLSYDPFIVVNGAEFTLPKPTRDPRWTDANAWYWQTGWPG